MIPEAAEPESNSAHHSALHQVPESSPLKKAIDSPIPKDTSSRARRFMSVAMKGTKKPAKSGRLSLNIPSMVLASVRLDRHAVNENLSKNASNFFVLPSICVCYEAARAQNLRTITKSFPRAGNGRILGSWSRPNRVGLGGLSHLRCRARPAGAEARTSPRPSPPAATSKAANALHRPAPRR